MFFTVLVNVAFKKLGCPEFDQEKMDKGLNAINSYYVGNGWYEDGPSDRYDHYIAFALHYYRKWSNDRKPLGSYFIPRPQILDPSNHPVRSPAD